MQNNIQEQIYVLKESNFVEVTLSFRFGQI